MGCNDHKTRLPEGAGPSGQASGDISSARCLDHVGIVVADADVGATSLRESLGLEVEHDERLSALGVRLVYLSCRSTHSSLDEPSPTIQLVQPIGPGPVADHLAEHGEGLHHVCFSVTVLEAALRRAGEDSPRPFLGGKGKRACFLTRKAAGALVELVEQQQGVARADQER
jgi:methylmalonyl-CoA/ethylmalonyl-CoA epimerase